MCVLVEISRSCTPKATRRASEMMADPGTPLLPEHLLQDALQGCGWGTLPACDRDSGDPVQRTGADPVPLVLGGIAASVPSQTMVAAASSSQVVWTSGRGFKQRTASCGMLKCTPGREQHSAGGTAVFRQRRKEQAVHLAGKMRPVDTQVLLGITLVRQDTTHTFSQNNYGFHY